MTTQKKRALASRRSLGAALLAVGTVLFFGKLAFLFADAPRELVGILPTIGMALVRASTTLPFAGHGLLGVVLGVLVSCWPLLLIAAGTVLLIQSLAAKQGPRPEGERSFE